MTGMASRPALIGKAPCQADFLRLNASSAMAHRFHGWLEEGVEGLARARAQLPDEPVAFVYTARGEREVLVGAFAPSADAVGRRFPLAIFTEVDGAALVERFPGTPEAFSAFLRGASNLLRACARATLTELTAQLAWLPLPSAEDLARAQETGRRSLGIRKAAPWVAPLRGSGELEGMECYALWTFVVACERERVRAPERAGVILDCPLADTREPFPWLELARRRLRWREAPPAFFWSRERLLLSLGPAVPSALGLIADPAQSASRLWPLRTSREQAITAAMNALPAPQRQALQQPEGSLAELLDLFSS